MRRNTSWLWLALVMLVLLPLAMFAQDTVAVVKDTVAVALPDGPFSIVGFIVANQMLFTTGLTSLVLYLAAKQPWFAQLQNWITRAVQAGVSFLVSFIVVKLGGEPDPAVTALATSALSVVVGGFIYRAGRTQPGNK